MANDEILCSSWKLVANRHVAADIVAYVKAIINVCGQSISA